jgi:hypothetical protein
MDGLKGFMGLSVGIGRGSARADVDARDLGRWLRRRRGPGSLAAGRYLAAGAFVPRVVRVVAGRVVVAGIAETARRDPFLQLLVLLDPARFMDSSLW